MTDPLPSFLCKLNPVPPPRELCDAQSHEDQKAFQGDQCTLHNSSVYTNHQFEVDTGGRQSYGISNAPLNFIAATAAYDSVHEELHEEMKALTFMCAQMRPHWDQVKSSAAIDSLTDYDLKAVFKHLPMHDRLSLSGVCRRWNYLAAEVWLGVKRLDLSLVPGEHINAVLYQCASLQSVISANRSFGLGELLYLGKHSNLTSIKLCACRFAVEEPCVAAGLFSAKMARAPCVEFVISGATFSDTRQRTVSGWVSRFSFRALDLPASLTHLHLSDLQLPRYTSLDKGFMCGLERLDQLKCLVFLDFKMDNEYIYGGAGDGTELFGESFSQNTLIGKISLLKNLEELCLGSLFADAHALDAMMSGLPKLQIFFFAHLLVEGDPDAMVDTIANHSSLRMLIIIGICEFAMELDPIYRQRSLKGADHDPLPVLDIFVGGYAAEFFVTDPEANAVVVHRVDRPILEFLEKDDVAPMFEGAWIAEQIKLASANQHGIISHCNP